MASAMARTVQSMLETTPLRSPRQGTFPTPRMVMPSASTSPTTAETLVVPMSRPTTISVVSIRLFIRLPPAPGKAPGRRRREPDTTPGSRPNFSIEGGGRSSHPHPHPLGVGVVVEEDHRGVGLAARHLGQDAGRLLDLVPVGGLPQAEGDGLAPHRRHQRPVLLP